MLTVRFKVPSDRRPAWSTIRHSADVITFERMSSATTRNAVPLSRQLVETSHGPPSAPVYFAVYVLDRMAIRTASSLLFASFRDHLSTGQTAGPSLRTMLHSLAVLLLAAYVVRFPLCSLRRSRLRVV